MKTNLTIALLALTLLHAPTAIASTNTYPPENAAVLYYKVISFYSPEDDIKSLIRDIANGDAPISKETIKHIEFYSYMIEYAVTAAGIEKCNWAIDFSIGMGATLPPLGEMRDVSRLILAETRLLASRGDYNKAFQRCVALEKMAKHVSGQTLLDGLVGNAISSNTDECMTYILSKMPLDEKTLLKLKTELTIFENRIERIESGLTGERIMLLANLAVISEGKEELTPEMLNEFEFMFDEETQQSTGWKEFKENIASLDKDFFKNSKDYHNAAIDEYSVSFNLPYAQAYNKIAKQIPDKLEADVKKKSEAVFSHLMMAPLAKAYSVAARSQNSLNALTTAVEIYIVKAKTGKLPDKIPAGSPKDLFSGKDFAYEKIDTGFTLRCKAKDLSKDTIHEYKFKAVK